MYDAVMILNESDATMKIHVSKSLAFHQVMPIGEFIHQRYDVFHNVVCVICHNVYK